MGIELRKRSLKYFSEMTTTATFTQEQRDEAKQIALTILNQLGGNRFIAFVGAKNLVSGSPDKPGLSFKIGQGAKSGITHVEIRLNSMDLYDVTYYKVRGSKIAEVASDKGIYDDMLAPCFEKQTGFYTKF